MIFNYWDQIEPIDRLRITKKRISNFASNEATLNYKVHIIGGCTCDSLKKSMLISLNERGNINLSISDSDSVHFTSIKEDEIAINNILPRDCQLLILFINPEDLLYGNENITKRIYSLINILNKRRVRLIVFKPILPSFLRGTIENPYIVLVWNGILIQGLELMEKLQTHMDLLPLLDY